MLEPFGMMNTLSFSGVFFCVANKVARNRVKGYRRMLSEDGKGQDAKEDSREAKPCAYSLAPSIAFENRSDWTVTTSQSSVGKVVERTPLKTVSSKSPVSNVDALY